MFREIKKKLLILENRRPWPAQAAAYIEEMDRADWIFTGLRLDDPSLQREDLLRLLKGQLLSNVPLSQHMAVESYQRVLRAAGHRVALGHRPDRPLAEELHQALTGDPGPHYRRNNPVLLSLDYNPPHFNEIDEQLAILFMQLSALDFQGNPIRKAAWLHNRFIEVYPFAHSNEATARNLMYYQLLLEGYPPFALNLSEQEYYAAIRQYLAKENMAPLYDAMERSIFNKLEVMLQLTASR